jgi:hypothetical protein
MLRSTKRRIPLPGRRSRTAAILALLGATASVWACDPVTGQPYTTRVVVDATPNPCIEPTCRRPVTLHVRGSGFVAGTTLRVLIRAVPDAGRPPLNAEFVLGSGSVAGDGTFAVERDFPYCVVVADPAVSDPLVVAAVDGSGNQRGFTLVPRDNVVCRPPFVTSRQPNECGEPRCTTLTTDGPTSIGVHWDGRDDEYNRYRVMYGPASGDTSTWTTTRNFGDDVSSVAVNNLKPKVLYGFQLQRCKSPLFGADDCAAWESIGEAATA